MKIERLFITYSPPNSETRTAGIVLRCVYEDKTTKLIPIFVPIDKIDILKENEEIVTLFNKALEDIIK